MFGVLNRGSEVGPSLNQRFPRRLVDAFYAADQGAHSGALNMDAKDFVSRCQKLAGKLERL